MGPVSLSAAALLLLFSPLIRGGNRHLALIVLEAIGIVIILAFCGRAIFHRSESSAAGQGIGAAQWLLLLSPALLALVYLLPVPVGFWAETPGRAVYLQTLRDAGVTAPAWLPLSVVPDATLTSLLAGIPLVAAFLVGRACSMTQLRWLARVVVVVALVQVLLGLLQISGGQHSTLYFGFASVRPIGTFANSNHFANYLATALVLHVWLARDSLASLGDARRELAAQRSSGRHFIALWTGGGLLLVVGILMSRSRGAAVSGLPMAALALGLVMAIGRHHRLGWRTIAAALAGILAAAIALIGVDLVLSRFGVDEIAGSASFRTLLTKTTLQGAAEFWPWGAGWGVYGAVYPRFQPPTIPGAAGHAHQDYAQMLFEGGIFALVFAAAFLWLAVRRAFQLARMVSRKYHLRGETIAAALCGLGLLGFLLHSLVEFNMHIPANAILASLLAGVYLRPLADSVEVR